MNRRLPFALIILFSLVTAGCRSETPPAEISRPSPVDVLISGGTVLTMSADFAVFDPGFVAIRGDSILAVGPQADMPAYTAEKSIDATGQWILPGLINGHQHAPMVLLRGLGDDRNLMDWLNQYIFPAEARNVDEEFVYWGTLLAAWEMLRTGTTTFVDMYYFEDKVAEAADHAGMRAVLGETIIGFPSPDSASPEDALLLTEAFLKKWADHPLVVPAVAPHAPYTCSREILLASRDLAEQYDAPLLIHLAETEDEVRQIEERTALSPVRYLDSIGFLVDRLIAAHVVWASPDEISLLKSRGVGVIHNPESNMKLASGVALVPEMMQLGVDLGLGTDGAASNNDLDLLQEMDTMAKLHKLTRRDPAVVKARDALAMATMGGARALNMATMIGSLEAGKRADVILLDGLNPAALPSYDPYATIVYALHGDSVRTVLIDGRVVMEDRSFPTLDVSEISRQAHRQQIRITNSLK